MPIGGDSASQGGSHHTLSEIEINVPLHTEDRNDAAASK